MRKKTWIRALTGLLAASALVVLPSTSAEAEELPPCAATDLVEGIARVNYPNGDFKISLTPTEGAHWIATWRMYDIWHLVQACVPGLYDETADRIYAQLACHADLSLLGDPSNDGAYLSGPTWDLESWKDTDTELHSLATWCSSDKLGYGAEHDEGTWQVYFGTPPAEAVVPAEEPSEEPAEAASGLGVSVDFTGGVGLWTRTGPGYDAGRLQVLPDGTAMTLLCQTRSETISDWTTSDLWDYVRLGDGQEVWVSDVFVQTGSNGQIAPDC